MKEQTKLGWICALLFLPFATIHAQATVSNTHASAFLTFAPNYFFQKNESNFFLHGQLNLFTEQRISFSGDAFYDLGSTSAYPTFNNQHQLFFGVNYHWRTSIHDLYLGMQPGIGLYRNDQALESRIPLAPLVSLQGGYRIYISPHFHFFFEGRFIGGQVISKNMQAISNLRFSAGLGFQL